MISLRRNLLVFLLGAVLLAVGAGAVATYRLALAEADEIFDYHLRQLALSLRDQAFARAPSPELPDEEFDFVVQVSDAGGVRLYLSHPHKVLPLDVQLGFSTIETAEGRWRVFSQVLRGQLVEVAQPMAVRSRMAFGAALKSVWPFVVILPVLGFALWWGIGRGLQPLDRLARGVAARSPGALDPLPMSGVPLEVQPLVQSVNDLLERLRLALDAQRAFVADAAHELRTPIAALKLQAQLLARAPDEVGRRAAADDLEAGVTRTARVVQQLLTLARVEPGAAEEPFGPVELEELARSVASDHAQVAISRGLDLGVAETRSVEIRGQKDALRTLLANLVENAIRYTPAGGHIHVRTGETGDRGWIEVADTGPGIPAQDRARVFDRFYRGSGAGETGSGLGLAIVKAIADRNRAELRLDDTPGGGLTVRVSFSMATV